MDVFHLLLSTLFLRILSVLTVLFLHLDFVYSLDLNSPVPTVLRLHNCNSMHAVSSHCVLRMNLLHCCAMLRIGAIIILKL